MKEEDDLGRYLRAYFAEYLPGQRGASPRTVRAYRDALKLLLCHLAKSRRCSVAELRIGDVDRDAVLAFLVSIETERGNGVATRNHRLAAIRAFVRFLSAHVPEAVGQCAQILAIPLKRGEQPPCIDYPTVGEMRVVLKQSAADTDTVQGRRDDALLSFLYNTGARVQEALDVRACDLHVDSPPHVLLRGKGQKERECPLWRDTVERLRRVVLDLRLDPKASAPIFTNRNGRALTRFGVRYILTKYVRKAQVECSSLTDKHLHPHSVRHATAMHLLQSGVDLNTVRCWLGHASVTTTNRYVEIDLEMKKAALETLTTSVVPVAKRRSDRPDSTLLTWLESL